MKKIVAVVYGGKSAEHDVSISTAFEVMKAIDCTMYQIVPVYITANGVWNVGEVRSEAFEQKEDLRLTRQTDAHHIEQLFQAGVTFDVVFPVLHGTNGEDGTVQGLFEVMNVPYVGNGVLASSAGMDKVVMKQLFEVAGLPQVPYVHFVATEWEQRRQALIDQMAHTLEYPYFVKPANLGSSVGISKVEDASTLEQAIEYALRFDRKVVVEQGIVAREIEVALLGNDDVICSHVGEIKQGADFYDYEAKYADAQTELIIPADVSVQVRKDIHEMALAAFKVLDCSGLVRADFFADAQEAVYINEVNTMPGFTPTSMYPQLWDKTGVSYQELVNRLLMLALERHQMKQNIQYTMN